MTIRPHYAEMLALHSIAETAFGISTADIFVEHYDNAILIRFKQADRDFTVTAIEGAIPAEQFKREWTEVVAYHNSLTNAERDAITERTKARVKAVELITAMALKGFVSRKTTAAKS